MSDKHTYLEVLGLIDLLEHPIAVMERVLDGKPAQTLFPAGQNLGRFCDQFEVFEAFGEPDTGLARICLDKGDLGPAVLENCAKLGVFRIDVVQFSGC